MAGSNQNKRESSITLTPKDVTKINRYIIDNSKYVPGNVKASAKWQNQSSKVLNTLGIS